tara:strand:+ start:10681 stop:11202 length:522 start_codon:yes stop_codon:yes gene_type:complete
MLLRISKYLFCIVIFSGCVLFEKDTAKEKIYGLPKPPYQKLYDADFERVWRAIQIVLSRYPIAVNNMDAGVLETDYIKMHEGWLPPDHPPVPPGGRKYKVNVQVARGTTPNASKPVVRVRVKKIVQLQRDFFSQPEDLKSDGLEEMNILYRIDREVQIDRGLERAFERMKKRE